MRCNSCSLNQSAHMLSLPSDNSQNATCLIHKGHNIEKIMLVLAFGLIGCGFLILVFPKD